MHLKEGEQGEEGARRLPAHLSFLGSSPQTPRLRERRTVSSAEHSPDVHGTRGAG